MTPKQLARDRRENFEALAAYANLGDTPEAWNGFRAQYPTFFPSTESGVKHKGFESISEWMYSFAEKWHQEFADHEVARRALPPLLWYRNRLRAVWSRNDRYGYNLAMLLGFDEEAKKVAKDHPGEVAADPLMRPMLIPGLFDPLEQRTQGLPLGHPIIDGVTGEIRWEFGCELQRSVYELMQERWRAKICPQCGKFFVSLTTAQKLCSDACSEAAIRERSLTWWNETGSERRAKAKSKARPR